VFESVLVADRGLIAVRVTRTAHRLGIKAIAVHSAADRGSMHARVADDSLLIGSAPAAESYLDVERIIEAAQVSGAEAVHPGRGFLAEQPDAAAAVQAAGLGWIGPSPEILRRAAALAGSRGPVEPAGRALEVQLLGLPDGRIVVLGLRGVSIGAAHPTVVEEPVQWLGPEDRGRVERAAAAVAETVELVGIATIDVRYDDGAIEVVAMRNRLQVGHSVTELVSGVDLVEQQLLVASGDPVSIDPDARRPGEDVATTTDGHAIAARVSAVDVTERTRIERWTAPKGDGIRVDSSYSSGDRYAPYYEPLLAEVAAHGPDRETALARIRSAVDAFTITGPGNDLHRLAAQLADLAG
jgi:acetyl/propionyl-CoA carboxylase alpha subunit